MFSSCRRRYINCKINMLLLEVHKDLLRFEYRKPAKSNKCMVFIPELNAEYAANIASRKIKTLLNMSTQAWYDMHILQNIDDKYCKNCGKPTIFRNIVEGYQECCCISCSTKYAYIKKPELHQIVSERTKAAMIDVFSDPVWQQKHRDGLHAAISKQSYHENLSNAQKKRFENPEERLKQSIAVKTAYENDSSISTKISVKVRKAFDNGLGLKIGESLKRGYKEHPERRTKLSNTLKERYKDAELRTTIREKVQIAAETTDMLKHISEGVQRARAEGKMSKVSTTKSKRRGKPQTINVKNCINHVGTLTVRSKFESFIIAKLDELDIKYEYESICIEYDMLTKHGNKRQYKPDLILHMPKGKVIAEIKLSYSIGEVELLKQYAAERYVIDNEDFIDYIYLCENIAYTFDGIEQLKQQLQKYM